MIVIYMAIALIVIFQSQWINNHPRGDKPVWSIGLSGIVEVVDDSLSNDFFILGNKEEYEQIVSKNRILPVSIF